jgi:DNA primase
MQPNWVDFKAVKLAVTMRMVLDHYAIDWLRKKGSELYGRCPIHKGTSEDSFNVNSDKNCFQCFAGSCGKRGNVLDFVAAMEKCSVRDAALKLADWFSIGSAAMGSEARSDRQTAAQLARKKEAIGERGEPNKPLKFGALQNVDHAHPYLAERGISRETAELFGVGFFSGRGIMSGRIVIPIYNLAGDVVAYAGRTLDDAADKYKFPPGFHKSLELYNAHRVLGQTWPENWDELVVVVEGFFDCMKLWQAGIPSVALMGSSLSDTQAEILGKDWYEALLMFDGDASGQTCTNEALVKLGRSMWVRAVMLGPDVQPDHLSPAEIESILDVAL